jgi:hypothetical protein
MAELSKITDEYGNYTVTSVNGDVVETKTVFLKDPEDALQTTDNVQKVTYTSNGIFTEVTNFVGETVEGAIIELDATGNAVAAVEGVETDAITLGANLKPYGDGTFWRQPGISRDLDGYTSLSGLVALIDSTNPIYPGDIIATIPAMVAPNLAEMFIVGSNIGPVRLDVNPTGEIKYTGTANITQYVSLSGIRFVSPQG